MTRPGRSPSIPEPGQDTTMRTTINRAMRD